MKRRAFVLVVFVLVALLGVLAEGCTSSSSSLLGRYDAEGTSVYSAIEILPGNVAKIYSPVLPSAYTTTYEQKGGYIFIKSDKGDLGYQVINSNTLSGPGGGFMGTGNIEYKKSTSTSSDN